MGLHKQKLIIMSDATMNESGQSSEGSVNTDTTVDIWDKLENEWIMMDCYVSITLGNVYTVRSR